MSNALAIHKHPSMRALADKSKTDLMRHVMSIKSGLQRHKEKAKTATVAIVGSVLASAGGAAAGVAAVKMPHLPKTRIRTDLALGAVLTGAAALGLVDELGPHLGAIGQGMLGYGTGDALKQQLLKMGWKQAA